MADSEYERTTEGEVTLFVVTPASSPKYGAFLAVALVPILFFGLVAFGIGSFISITLYLGFIGVIFYVALFHDFRPKEQQTVSRFHVSPAGVQLGGRTFKPGDIHRLIVKNRVADTEVGSTTVVAGNAAAHQVAGAYATGQEQRQRIARVSNSLELETGGKAYILAGGMTETTAFGLMTDVAKILRTH